jgi:hypothetical protein
MSTVKLAKSMKLAKEPSKSTRTTFPFTYKKPAAVKMLRKIVHRLKRKKGQYTEISVQDRLTELFDPVNVKWHKHLALLQKKGLKFKRGMRIKFAMVKLKDIFIDDDIQRDMDPDHIVKIANIENFRVPFMSAIQGTKEVGKWRFHSTNAQHTVVLEAAYAFHGLWEDYTGDWKDLEVPFLYIETDDRSMARQAFRVLNGKFSKPIGPYDHHKIEVLSYRVDGNMETENKQSATLQQICEDNGFEPISEDDDDNAGHPKSITHISAMRKYKEKPQHWEFILKTHAKYWPNIKLHGMEIDLYGFMYDYFKVKMKVDVYSKKFQSEFLDSFHAIIQTLFSTPENLSSESANTFKRWYAKTWDVSVDEAEKKVEAQASFVLLMKMYRQLGGSQQLPDIVDLYDNSKAGDLTKYLSAPVKKAMKVNP